MTSSKALKDDKKNKPLPKSKKQPEKKNYYYYF